MKASRSDFYTLAPTAPVAVNFLPPDFDADLIARLAAEPLAPEVRECEACQWRACHAQLRVTGWPLKPACADMFALDGAAQPKRITRLTRGEIETAILRVFADGRTHTVYEAQAATGVSYSTARAYIERFVTAGRLAPGGWRNTRQAQRDTNVTGQQRLYCLPGCVPADARERKPRKAREVNQAKERAAANNARLLALLAEHGPLDAATLAGYAGLSDSITRRKLAAFVAQGRVAAAGYALKPTGREGATPCRCALWAITERSN